MEAVDIRAALAEVPEQAIGEETTEEHTEAAFPQLAPFNSGGVFVGRFRGVSPWERHAEGDELLHVLDGEVGITVMATPPFETTIGAGSIFVVPRGLWHRLNARTLVTLLWATPKPTEISFAEDPR